MNHTMKAIIIKSIMAALALVGLLLLVADMPEATIVKIVIAKAAGALLLLASARIMEKYIPEETV